MSLRKPFNDAGITDLEYERLGRQLINAVKLNDMPAIKKLLFQKRVDINYKDINGETPLHHASSREDEELAHFLLDNNADPGIQSDRLETPMHVAARKGSKKLMKKMLDYGGVERAMNARDRNQGRMVHHIAAYWDNVDVLELLLDEGARIEAQDRAGNTALHLAAELGEIKSLRLLISKGASVNKVVTNTGESPLHCAASKGQYAVVEALLRAGADPNKQNFFNQTPLHLSATHHGPIFESVEKLLIQYGADLTIQASGQTPYDVANRFFSGKRVDHLKPKRLKNNKSGPKYFY